MTAKTQLNPTTNEYCKASEHPFYSKWNNMKSRCLNPSDKDYKYYGGRGITVHSDFLNFQNYIDYINSLTGYSEGYTIDRIDNDGNYEPGNIRWAPRSTQSSNRRSYIKQPDCSIFLIPNKIRKPYRAFVSTDINGKRRNKHIGYFETYEEALEARCEFLKSHLPTDSHWQEEIDTCLYSK